MDAEATASTPPHVDPEDYLPLLRRALDEDHAGQDVTARALIDAERMGVAEILAKQDGVLSGRVLLEPLFQLLDARCRVEGRIQDGERFEAGQTLLRVLGPARALVSGERAALNFLRHLSGVATLAARFVSLAEGSGARVHDTRKTTPGLRQLEKYAVRCGGAANHRLHLADAGMIKENHLRAAYGATGPEAIARAVATCRAALPEGMPLYVEVENLPEFDAAVEAGATILMLDEFTPEDLARAVETIRTRPLPHPRLEVTGGVDLERIAVLASAGVERISIGALTHSAPAIDLSMKLL